MLKLFGGGGDDNSGPTDDNESLLASFKKTVRRKCWHLYMNTCEEQSSIIRHIH